MQIVTAFLGATSGMICSQTGSRWSFYTELCHSCCTSAVCAVVYTEGNFAWCLPCLQAAGEVSARGCLVQCLLSFFFCFGECVLRAFLCVGAPRDSNNSSSSKGLKQKRGDRLVSFSKNTHNSFSHWNPSLVCVSASILRFDLCNLYVNGALRTVTIYEAIFTRPRWWWCNWKPLCHNFFLIEIVLRTYESSSCAATCVLKDMLIVFLGLGRVFLCLSCY